MVVVAASSFCVVDGCPLVVPSVGIKEPRSNGSSVFKMSSSGLSYSVIGLRDSATSCSSPTSAWACEVKGALEISGIFPDPLLLSLSPKALTTALTKTPEVPPTFADCRRSSVNSWLGLYPIFSKKFEAHVWKASWENSSAPSFATSFM